MKKAMVFIVICGSIIGLVACSSMAGEGRSRGRGKVSFDELDKNSNGLYLWKVFPHPGYREEVEM